MFLAALLDKNTLLKENEFNYIFKARGFYLLNFFAKLLLAVNLCSGLL